MSRPNYSAARLALLHHLDLSGGQRPPLPPPFGKSAACYLEPRHWHLHWWYWTGRWEHSQISKDVLNCPSYQINLLCGAFVGDRPADLLLACVLRQLFAGFSIVVKLFSFHGGFDHTSAKKQMNSLKGESTKPVHSFCMQHFCGKLNIEFTNHLQSSVASHHLRWYNAAFMLCRNCRK